MYKSRGSSCFFGGTHWPLISELTSDFLLINNSNSLRLSNSSTNRTSNLIDLVNFHQSHQPSRLQSSSLTSSTQSSSYHHRVLSICFSLHLILIVVSKTRCMTDNLNTSAASKPTNTNQASTTQTTDSKPDMDKINAMILKTAIEAIPLLTQDNYSMWSSRMMNFFELQKIKDTFIKEDTENLTGEDELQARTILISKLDPSIHSNVINHENNSNAIMIWKSIVHHFASTQAANQARVWNQF
ncbi:hypothetical protein PGT21_033832 [Puccinia graminis f. sp. tritici]|uniref:DUF4219 domain-containing protein n=1 Tax=Puccinia graminis f. sp. tritici TaxID=56615 RepID=A0A5B0QQ10_PUCGR|nr:hypothetical protein PGT21_033832 [Puccinia graminis f. sp. tritici]